MQTKNLNRVRVVGFYRLRLPPAGGSLSLLISSGDGKLGLLIAQVLNARGITAHLYGRRHKLRIAAGAGVQTWIVKKKLPAAAYDWVVEATGSQDGLSQAIRMVRPRGSIFMKSTVHGKAPIDTAPVIVNEITLVGSRCGRFEPALGLLRTRSINVHDMIYESFPLLQARRAFQRAAESGILKVLLKAG